jgi:2-succinyl-6-hydroxy-2,4-cyclohexadiene-1-carboxylate synthase
MTRVAVNGIALNVEDEGAGPALMLLHGFTGDVSTWQPLLAALPGFRTVRVDLIGHGRSDAPDDPQRYSLENAASDLAAVLDALGIERTAVLGYSLGGRVALQLAVEQPQRLWALALESASPGIASATERGARIDADNALADALLRDGIKAFVDSWQAQPLFASQLRLPARVQEAQRRVRLSQKPIGLANSLRGMGAGRQEYMLPRLRDVTPPTLIMAGSLDGKYVALQQDMMAALAKPQALTFTDAGHAAHLEQPEVFAGAVATFLNRCSHGEAPNARLQELRS